jgi:hypothetical protein
MTTETLEKNEVTVPRDYRNSVEIKNELKNREFQIQQNEDALQKAAQGKNKRA